MNKIEKHGGINMENKRKKKVVVKTSPGKRATGADDGAVIAPIVRMSELPNKGNLSVGSSAADLDDHADSQQVTLRRCPQPTTMSSGDPRLPRILRQEACISDMLAWCDDHGELAQYQNAFPVADRTRENLLLAGAWAGSVVFTFLQAVDASWKFSSSEQFSALTSAVVKQCFSSGGLLLPEHPSAAHLASLFHLCDLFAEELKQSTEFGDEETSRRTALMLTPAAIYEPLRAFAKAFLTYRKMAVAETTGIG